MTNVTKLKDGVHAAQAADDVLNSKALKAAFEAVEKDYLNALLMADEKDDLGRFRYAEAIKVIKLVSHHLRIVVESGKLASADLDAMKGKRNRFF